MQSASLKIATLVISASASARAIRTAISPRLAIRTFLKATSWSGTDTVPCPARVGAPASRGPGAGPESAELEVCPAENFRQIHGRSAQNLRGFGHPAETLGIHAAAVSGGRPVIG